MINCVLTKIGKREGVGDSGQMKNESVIQTVNKISHKDKGIKTESKKQSNKDRK